MILSENEINEFIKIRRFLKFERYKILISATMIFLSIMLNVFYDELALTFSILALLPLIEIYFSQKSKELLIMYEKILSSESQNINILANSNKSHSKKT